MNPFYRLPLVVFLVECFITSPGFSDEKRLALPWDTALENRAERCEVTGPTELEMTAPPKTDLYISSDGKYRINRSPRLLFKPEGPFIFTAKIRVEHKSQWDAGALLLFNDEEHFAKLCYELDTQGVQRIVSVVCNGVADDCNSMPVPIPDRSVYYRITGNSSGNTFVFYVSIDGKSWTLLRTFRIEKTEALRVGFSVQSPSGEGCAVHFSEIRLEQRYPKNYWTGE